VRASCLLLAVRAQVREVVLMLVDGYGCLACCALRSFCCYRMRARPSPQALLGTQVLVKKMTRRLRPHPAGHAAVPRGLASGVG
jgi:hypothetical protein